MRTNRGKCRFGISCRDCALTPRPRPLSCGTQTYIAGTVKRRAASAPAHATRPSMPDEPTCQFQRRGKARSSNPDRRRSGRCGTAAPRQPPSQAPGAAFQTEGLAPFARAVSSRSIACRIYTPGRERRRHVSSRILRQVDACACATDINTPQEKMTKMRSCIGG